MPFTKPTPVSVRASLAHDLKPVADDLRDLYTQFGLRPYVVRLIRTRWTGGKRGIGQEEVVDEHTLLPTPRVRDLSGLREVLQPVGLDELGDVQVDQISPKMTEDELRFLDKHTAEPARDDEAVWWDIEFVRPDGLPGLRRRFVLVGAPDYRADRFGWSVRLAKAHEDRGRDGIPR